MDALLSNENVELAGLEAWIWGAGRLGAAVLLGLALHFVAVRILAQVVRRTPWGIDDRLLESLRNPSRWLVVILAVMSVLPTLEPLAPQGVALARHVASLAAIATGVWLALATIRGTVRHLAGRHDLSVEDNLEARRVHTQLDVLARALAALVLVVGLSVALMTFPRIRQLGTSLLASAGIAGLALGLAVRPVLENLFAGLQIALTQPIRLDDVVIVDGEWGRVEEITGTYVVLRLWDERRLIVPFARFLQAPFENWTRTRSDIVGTIFLYTDYTVEVGAVRDELRRVVQASPLWDRRVCVLQVTNATPQALELRALVSASDSSRAWDLRVQTREALVGFLQREFPDALPRARVELCGGREEPLAGATAS